MKNILHISVVFIGLVFLSSCNTGPQPIDYGNDGCHFCKMTIVDKIHAAELITDKGKVFKFDATECMLHYMSENKELPIGSLLINYYEQPTKFIPTEEATFLISQNLPSPMGAYLTAFKNKEEADKIMKEKGGALYTWETLKVQLEK